MLQFRLIYWQSEILGVDGNDINVKVIHDVIYISY